VPGISDELEQELKRVLKRPLPSGMAEGIADGLRNCNGRQIAEGKRTFAHRVHAVKQIVLAGERLQRVIKRADAASGRKPPVSTSRGLRPIDSSWDAVGEPLARMLGVLQPWLAMRAPTTRERGNPHEGRRELRLAVFGVLTDAGISISRNAQGAAAQILLAVFEEADRLDGKSRTRSSFNGSQWTTWVAEYKYIEKMAEARVPLSGLQAWIDANPFSRRARSGK
jgi:hypothetical protein